MMGVIKYVLMWVGGALGVVTLVLLTKCTNNEKTFRFRVNFAVNVNGETKSASSIIQAWYLKLGSPNAGGATGTAWHRGVAPVIDLGEYGYLIASMDAICPYPTEIELRSIKSPVTTSKKYGEVCKRAVSATELPKAFGVGYGKELEQVRVGKRDLADDNYPAFIWIAKGADWRQTKRICPEEFSSVIGADVTLKSISIEAAPDAPLIHKLEIQAPWIEQMRSDRDSKYRGSSFAIPDYCMNVSNDYEW